MAKKTTKKTAPAKENDTSALPESEEIPEGFQQIDAGYAPTWKPDEHGKVLHGKVTGGVRDVEMTIRKKTEVRRCMEITAKKTGERFTLWESAALAELFEHIVESGEGPEVYVRFDGYGKKKPGQNAPKLFTVAIKE